MNQEKEQKCYLCQNQEFEKIKGIVRDNKKLRVKKCKHCSLVTLSSSEHINSGFYEAGEMHNESFSPEDWAKASLNDDTRRFLYLKNKIKNKTILDFGCGAGGFIKLAQNVALQVYGTELEIKQRNFLTNLGLKVYENISEIKDKIKIITMFHVLEHIKDPIPLLKSFKDILADEASELIIEVPNANDALLTLYKSKAFSHFTWWSCHLYTYNLQTLQALLNKAGYKINYTKKIQRYGIANHLYWLIKGKPGGHKKLKFISNKLLDFIYEKILSVMDKTDTILISASKL